MQRTRSLWAQHQYSLDQRTCHFFAPIRADNAMRVLAVTQLHICLEAFLVLRIICPIIETCESIQADKVVNMRNRMNGLERNARQISHSSWSETVKTTFARDARQIVPSNAMQRKSGLFLIVVSNVCETVCQRNEASVDVTWFSINIFKLEMVEVINVGRMA